MQAGLRRSLFYLATILLFAAGDDSVCVCARTPAPEGPRMDLCEMDCAGERDAVV